MCAILRLQEDQCNALAKDAASLPLRMGGLGLRSAVRTSNSAYWASWADSLPMVRERHPGVADMIVDTPESDPATPIFFTVVEAVRAIQVANFEPPSWASLSHGARTPPREPDEFEPGCSRRGWQHEAASRTETVHRDTWIMPRTTSGQCCVPTAAQDLVWHCRPFPPVLFSESSPITSRVLLLRRLRLPLLQVSRTCRCTTAQRAAELECWAGGVMLWRAWELGSAARQGRGSQRMSSFETWISWHPTFRTRGGWKSWPRVSHCTVEHSLRWTPHWCRRTMMTGRQDLGAAHIDGAALVVARRQKERAYPELVGPRSRTKLVVLAGEVGGRWSEETVTFLRLLAAARARSESALPRLRAEQARRMRWGGLLARAAARAVAASLLEHRSNVGGDATPDPLTFCQSSATLLWANGGVFSLW